MKLTFNSQEIEQALISYVSTQGIDLSNKTVTVNMTAGRGPNGHTAELDIVNNISPTNSSPTPKAISDTQPAPAKPFDADDMAEEEEDVPFNTEPKDTKPVDFS